VTRDFCTTARRFAPLPIGTTIVTALFGAKKWVGIMGALRLGKGPAHGMLHYGPGDNNVDDEDDFRNTRKNMPPQYTHHGAHREVEFGANQEIGSKSGVDLVSGANSAFPSFLRSLLYMELTDTRCDGGLDRGTSFVVANKLDTQLTLLYRAFPSWWK
jgi:hypothetical protein